MAEEDKSERLAEEDKSERLAEEDKSERLAAEDLRILGDLRRTKLALSLTHSLCCKRSPRERGGQASSGLMVAGLSLTGGGHSRQASSGRPLARGRCV